MISDERSRPPGPPTRAHIHTHTHTYTNAVAHAHSHTHKHTSTRKSSLPFQESSCRTPVLRAGAETRSAMAFYVDLADYTASADKAYADAEPTVCRMDEWSFLDRWRKIWQ